MNSPQSGTPHWLRKLSTSRFFTISVAFHFILVLFGGTAVLIAPRIIPNDLEAVIGETETDQIAVNLPKDSATPLPPTFKEPDATTRLPIISTNTESLFDIQVTPFDVPKATTSFGDRPTVANDTLDRATRLPTPPADRLPKETLAGVKQFTKDWVKPSQGGTSIQKTKVEFTAYLAKYGSDAPSSQGGDWAATHRLENGNITTGSLPNLLYFMNKNSRGNINAIPDPVALDLASDEIFAKRPPFIFFTGHRDFVLSEREVANLQKYIRHGGCIWGDSSLPGARSRFDLAFRREMRRVIPDADKQWETLPANHALYTKNLYYPEIRNIPQGMNYYQEPAYALKYGGEIAILYTANDYGDIWQIGLDAKGNIDFSYNEKGQYIAVNHSLWNQREILYRNLDVKAIHDSFKFGTNVVMHLLTRWDEQLSKSPTGM